MTDKQQVETMASAVFSTSRLDWVIASVEEDKASRTWNIEVQTPDGRELILSVPQGSPKEVRSSITQQTEEEMDRLHSH
jgi:hypothetical protein